jgi:hypothetical protein
LNIRELVAAATNPKPVQKTIPELGVVYIRVLTVGEALNAKEDVEEAKRDPLKIGIRGFCRYLVDEHNMAQYDAANPDDFAILSSLRLDVLRSVMEEGNRVNGIGDATPAKN